ncbi:hypothetical protein Xmau_03350 [Xenorhabdus mauleonii]|uniref:Uncharacterized protein n=1 Tax=Xenorhabdus mauleonii TaxID=351675 RepID=A0A2G0NV51_9GAMM|nr:hypothetical protein Xmau_03350 [Xenorhabdus mauleonii]
MPRFQATALNMDIAAVFLRLIPGGGDTNVPPRIQVTALRVDGIHPGFGFRRLTAVRELNANGIIRFFRLTARLVNGVRFG